MTNFRLWNILLNKYLYTAQGYSLCTFVLLWQYSILVDKGNGLLAGEATWIMYQMFVVGCAGRHSVFNVSEYQIGVSERSVLFRIVIQKFKTESKQVGASYDLSYSMSNSTKLFLNRLFCFNKMWMYCHLVALNLPEPFTYQISRVKLGN